MSRDESKGGEGKECESKGGESKDADGDVVDVTEVSISPNDCDFDEPLHLDVYFAVTRELLGAQWHISFLVDTVGKRHIVDLGSTPPADYAGRDCFFSFSCAKIDVANIAPSTLANCGLLIATLKERSGREVVSLNCVAQVARNKATGKVTRMIYSPIE
ncbi:hypothetical protein M885DRAFT_522097 [Pelagophyceae sp. CCMP2097]|nr:hypothetical protein M885DRAFT_522097 [Pelagophyceae sp. CCMP2097]